MAHTYCVAIDDNIGIVVIEGGNVVYFSFAGALPNSTSETAKQVGVGFFAPRPNRV